MGIATYPAAAGGGIKSVQRGSASGAGNVTITAVDISKSFVTVFGTTSSGTVSASFGLNSSNVSVTEVGEFYGNSPCAIMPTGSTSAGNATTIGTGFLQYTRSNPVNAFGVNAGSNNLVSAVVQGFLANSTTLTVSGACRWEVVEFN